VDESRIEKLARPHSIRQKRDDGIKKTFATNSYFTFVAMASVSTL
jgi:hypothetical protein